jgi:uncharacterized protein (DUF427 family)
MATRFSQALPGDLRFEPSPKWIRAELGGVTVVDSKRALLVWEPGHAVPGYCFPEWDVRTELLRPQEAAASDEHQAPLASLWTIEANGRSATAAAWEYADDDLRGCIALRWNALDRWLEEDEEMVGHPRDPFHRIDVLASSRHVRVALDGETIADSARPRLLFETGLPRRYYLPREDVRMDLLAPTDKRTVCAYKGFASYFSARLDDAVHENVAWTYLEPLRQHPEIRELIAFFNERADIVVDGEPEERPVTQWSHGV